jgi:hypothetical protein
MKEAANVWLRARAGWLIPAGLLLLSILPLMGGTLRMLDLATGEPTPKSIRFFESPTPIVLHAISSLIYFILGAFQFSASLRRRRPEWHRKAGRILIASGLVSALSGVWMACFYPRTIGNGPAAAVIRVLVGAAITVFICNGYAAILRRNIPAHRAWMIRAYALAIAAGTQPLTLAPIVVVPAFNGELGLTLGLTAGWILNLLVAEWVIRRRSLHTDSGAPIDSAAQHRQPTRPRPSISSRNVPGS